MGFWSSLFGGRRETARSGVVWLLGDGEFSFEIIGEGRCQKALEAMCGGRTKHGAKHDCIAYLVPEPNNRHDRNAVRIELRQASGQGATRTVGYLARDLAEDYHDQMAELGLAMRVACCKARIVGGWDRGARDRGHFGVKLDLAWPIKRGQL